MTIYKNMDIKISDGTARFNEKFYVYQNDRGVELHLSLNLSKTNFGSTTKRLVFSNDLILVGATIVKPNGEIIGRDRVEMVDDIIKFKIDEELTNDIDEIGIYKIQFHLYDEHDNRITIPPVEFEVRELIGVIEESKPTVGVVDYAKVNFSTVAEDTNSIEIVSNGRYIKTNWISGDLITAKKLNKIETTLEDLDSRLDEVTINDLIDIEKIPYTIQTDDSISSVKDALDKLLYFDLSIDLISDKDVLVEQGAVLSNIVFKWNYNKPIESQTFNGNSLDKLARSYIYTGSLDSNKTFTLNANDGKNNFSKSIDFTFLNGIYWGVSSEPNYDNNLISSLSKELSTSKDKIFSVDCGIDEYIFYCVPSAFGELIFAVNGFVGGFVKVNTIKYSNMYGHTEDYDIWKSVNCNLGNTTVVIT